MNFDKGNRLNGTHTKILYQAPNSDTKQISINPNEIYPNGIRQSNVEHKKMI